LEKCPIQRPVLDGFEKMMRGYGVLGVGVGDGSGDLEDAVVGAGAQAQLADGCGWRRAMFAGTRLAASPITAILYSTALVVLLSAQNALQVIPMVNRLMSSMASRISSMRNFQAPAGIYRLFEYLITQLSLQGCWSHQVDSSSEKFFQSMLKPEKRKDSNRALELHEDVNIAFWPSLTSNG
jgi:hypothetical protein